MIESRSATGGTAPRAAVIGSGFGGLAAAIRLQSAGFHTVVFEARDKPGGRAYVYEQDGFIFDGGPTVITAPTCLEELFALSGRKLADYVELIPVSPLYRLIWSDGDRMDYVASEDAMAEQIRQRNPADAEGFRRFVAYTSEVFHKGYQGLAAEPFLRFTDMVRVAPQLIKLRADRSVYATVARFVQNEHVRQALSFHSLLVGGNPFDTSSIYTLIHYLERNWGVTFPRGGTGALVRALVKLLQELGGEIRLDTPVRRAELQRNGRARHVLTTDAGARETFDLVVSNADLSETYGPLYGDLPEAESMRGRLDRLDWSMSLFVLYFGTDRVYDGVAHHTILFARRYRELLRDIFEGSRLPDDFSLYLHMPTATDASLAPPGCSTFYVLSPVPHLGHAPVDWGKTAAPYADKILAALEVLLPDVRRHVKVRCWLTPWDFRSVLRARHGSAFSVSPKLTQSAWFRPHNRDPHIPGLYLVGAGTHPGAGVPGVINSAKATAEIVFRDFGRPARAS
jgi:phytoene desaturase